MAVRLEPVSDTNEDLSSDVLDRCVAYRIRRQLENLECAMAQGHVEMLCAVYGHVIEDCSTAGPDSGDADYVCARCGKYWSVPLY